MVSQWKQKRDRDNKNSAQATEKPEYEGQGNCKTMYAFNTCDIDAWPLFGFANG
jgi:hypothetical protein